MKRTDVQTSVKAVNRQRLTFFLCKSNAEESKGIFETQKPCFLRWNYTNEIYSAEVTAAKKQQVREPMFLF